MSGATGFIGQNLLGKLLANGVEVHVVVREGSDLSLFEKEVKFFHYDQEISTLLEYTEREQFDGVIHLASLFLAAHTPQDIPALIDSNVRFATELLEAAKSTHIGWFLNTGTFWQHYESDGYNPVNLYAATKEAFEVIAKYYTETSNLLFTTLKLNDTFGPNDTRNKVFNLWSKIAQTGETLEMSAGEQYIDISYIEDVVEAYFLLCKALNEDEKQTLQHREFVVTQEQRVTLKELSLIFQNAIGKNIDITWGAREYREREVMEPYNNGERVPGWQQKYSLEDAIKKTIGESV